MAITVVVNSIRHRILLYIAGCAYSPARTITNLYIGDRIIFAYPKTHICKTCEENSCTFLSPCIKSVLKLTKHYGPDEL